MIKNLEQYPIVRDIKQTKEDLINFEELIVNHWGNAKIRGPIHLSNGNEDELIKYLNELKHPIGHFQLGVLIIMLY